MQTTTKYQNVPGMSPVTMKLIDGLKNGKHGDMLTDTQLSAICGEPTAPGQKGYAKLASAIRYCKRHHGVVWCRQYHGGLIKCLDDAERLDYTHQRRRKARRVIRDAGLIASTIDLEKLPAERRAEHAAITAQLRGLAVFTDSGFTKALVASRANVPPTADKLLTAFK